MNLDKLKEPFKTIKWRVQSFSKNKPLAICIPYIDARDVMNRLDDVVGVENWQCDYKEIKGVMYCGIAINLYYDSDEEVKEPFWVWKWDAGSESQVEKEKGEASDAFKRAFVKWGGARDLYEADFEYVAANVKKESNNHPYCIDKNKKRIYDLTHHINEIIDARKNNPPWFGEAVKFLSNGGTIEAIREKYEVSDELADKLMADAI